MFGIRKFIKAWLYRHFWSKVELYTPPRSYDGLIGIKEYGYLVDCCLHYFSKKNIRVIGIRNGAFVVEGEGDMQYHYPLDKLLYSARNTEQEKWLEIVFNHFESIKLNTKAYIYLFKDLDFSMQFLRLYSNFDPSVSEQQKQELIHVPRKRFDDYLVLHFEEHFRFIRKDEISEWETSIENLLQIAKENTLAEMLDDEDRCYTDEETEQGVTTKPVYYALTEWLNLTVVPVRENVDFYHA